MTENPNTRQGRRSEISISETTTELARLIREYLHSHNYQGIADLLARYRTSEQAVLEIENELLFQKMDMLLAMYSYPEQVAQKEMRNLMQNLCNTELMQREGTRLADITAEKATPRHGHLALHTYMLDAWLKQHPESNIPRPEAAEVQAAERILDRQLWDYVLNDLYHLALREKLIRGYVPQRYGMAEECRKLETLFQAMVEDTSQGIPDDLTRGDFTMQQIRLEKRAEEILEAFGVMQPEEYLDKLEGELRALETLVKHPERAAETDAWLLFKYGILEDGVPDLKLNRVEAACRALDARLVRMTGRPPRAEKLFAELVRERKTQTKARSKKVTRPMRNAKLMRKTQGKGRKMGL